MGFEIAMLVLVPFAMAYILWQRKIRVIGDTSMEVSQFIPLLTLIAVVTGMGSIITLSQGDLFIAVILLAATVFILTKSPIMIRTKLNRITGKAEICRFMAMGPRRISLPMSGINGVKGHVDMDAKGRQKMTLLLCTGSGEEHAFLIHQVYGSVLFKRKFKSVEEDAAWIASFIGVPFTIENAIGHDTAASAAPVQTNLGSGVTSSTTTTVVSPNNQERISPPNPASAPELKQAWVPPPRPAPDKLTSATQGNTPD